MKKQCRNLSLLISLFISLTALSGCGSNNKWNYSKQEAAKFFNLNGEVEAGPKNESNYFIIDEDYFYFKDKVNVDDVIVFNYTDLQNRIETSNDNKDSYLSYDVISKSKSKVTSVEVSDNQHDLRVTFDGNDKDIYGLLVAKDATNVNNYLFSIANSSISEKLLSSEQSEFETKYLKSEKPGWNIAKTVINVIGNISQIITGYISKSPTAISAGIFGILTTLGDAFFGNSGPTLVDIYNKLVEIDAKLDAINEKIDKNHNQLLEEIIRTQAQVDRVLQEQYEANITAFNTDFLMPLGDFERNLSDYISQQYKEFVKTSQTLRLNYAKDEEGKWQHYSIKEDPSELIKFDITIPEFPNASAFLKAHGNVVEKGFIDELNKDIDAAVEKTAASARPQGLDPVLYRNNITEQIAEMFMNKKYSEDHQSALDLKNKFINFCSRITGQGSESIVKSYVDRMKYMFNFAKEGKDSYRSLLANLLYHLDKYAASASAACKYAEIAQKDLGEAYESARDYITKTFDELMKLDDKFCYQNGAVINGGFYQAKEHVWFTNCGNHPDFHEEINLYHVYSDNLGVKYDADNLNNHNFMNTAESIRIATRWRLMRENGYSSDTKFVDYLVNAQVIDKKDLNGYVDLIARGWIRSDCWRVFTGLSSRGLGDGDRNLYLTCTAKGGKSGSDYFDVNECYYYKGHEDAEYWSGVMYETSYLNGDTGYVDNSEKKVCAYARYSEAHTLWINDEYWAFIDNPAGNYFFAIFAK